MARSNQIAAPYMLPCTFSEQQQPAIPVIITEMMYNDLRGAMPSQMTKLYGGGASGTELGS